jgi:hypothetical protein
LVDVFLHGTIQVQESRAYSGRLEIGHSLADIELFSWQSMHATGKPGVMIDFDAREV